MFLRRDERDAWSLAEKAGGVVAVDCPTRMSGLVLSPPGADPGWVLIEDGVDPAREREIESLFALGNGYVGARASIGEGGRFSRPATFIAGIYVADGGLGPRLAVLPHWLHVAVTVEGQLLSPDAGRVLAHRRTLDLRRGILWREWRQEDPSGRITRLVCHQLASLADRHLLFQSMAITAENYAGKISLTARLGPAEATRTDVERVRAEAGALVMRVSGKEVAVAAASQLQDPAFSMPTGHEGGVQQGGEERWSWEVGLGETVHLDRILAVFTSRDVASPAKAACDHLTSARARGVRTAAGAHVDAWRRKWEAADIRIVGDEQAQRALRFAVYHLIAAANPGDDHVSIAARGLTGEAYRGRVFWDTEIYMLPFYALSDPPAARALLMYRYHTLDAARRKARAQGYGGALYAWESADTGEEVTPHGVVAPDGRLVVIRTGEREHHISADIAYGVWQYWRVTGDDAFMVAAGMEILVETARFWANRARVESDGRAHIPQVIGPDEYHELVDDNAYTNTMAAFNLEHAADAVAILSRGQADHWQRLAARLDITDSETRSWRALAGKLVTGFDPATKLFEQFAGYFRLEELDTTGHQGCPTAIDVCLGAERVSQSKVIKQADVVALSTLLWDQWPIVVHEANFRYYEPRTAHGSSLSPALHALVAARLGDAALAHAYFRQAAEIDLANNMGNASGGVHMAALGGLWQAAVFGAAGLQVRENGIAVDPHLLPGWSELAFPVQWRGRVLRLRFAAAPRRIEVAVEKGEELTVALTGGPACRARGGQRFALQGDRSGWGNWTEVGR
jgi:kojibiose phosphorylase